jgi:para-nitrobenzyl esterase
MFKKILLVVVGILIILVAWQMWPKNETVTPSGPLTSVIQTKNGAIRGFMQDNLEVFLGIPYAEPPTGKNRFRPPVAHKPWNGTLEAYGYGHFCPQAYDKVVIEDPKEDLNNEDCLTLNIWSPGTSDAKRPVMVYIHGGGFVGGSSKEALYNGDMIAQKGDVVVVSMNYRLGLLGFLDFSTIGGSDYTGSADVGIQDQLLALRWVKENISAFGGDPDNITVFGESAGGGSAESLLGIDQPQNYFKRMIVMSGSPIHTAQNTSDIANLIKTETGISWPLAWKYMPTQLVMYIQQKLLTAVGSPLSDLIFAPTYGIDYVIKRSPTEAVSAGTTKGIDLMIGTMADEMSYWSFYDTPTSHICEQTVQDNLFTMVDPTIEPQIQDLYDIYSANPLRADRTEGEIILAMGDDYAFRVSAIQLATEQTNAAKTFLYRVDYPVNIPEQPCQNNRSPHGSELPFVFGRYNDQAGINFIGPARDATDNATREHLSEQMISAWTNFAKTGNPNGGNLPNWPVFNGKDQPTMIFSGSPHIENAPFLAEYQAMSEFMKVFSVFDALK